jgi:hypothetical protein
MNRRNFISGILAAGAAFTVLPGTGRVWKPIDRFAITDIKYSVHYHRTHSFQLTSKYSIKGKEYMIADLIDYDDSQNIPTYKECFAMQMKRTQERLRKGQYPPFSRLSS